MKKLIAFLVLALLLASGPAFALSCKSGNLGSDECWTNVKVSSSETNPVIAGTVLVYDFASSPDTDTSAFQVRVATASADAYRVAGIAQSRIATGDVGAIQVRGKGKVRLAGGVASADRLFTSATAGTLGAGIPAGNTVASRDSVIAFALQTVTSASTIDAYIVVV